MIRQLPGCLGGILALTLLFGVYYVSGILGAILLIGVVGLFAENRKLERKIEELRAEMGEKDFRILMQQDEHWIIEHCDEETLGRYRQYHLEREK